MSSKLCFYVDACTGRCTQTWKNCLNINGAWIRYFLCLAHPTLHPILTSLFTSVLVGEPHEYVSPASTLLLLRGFLHLTNCLQRPSRFARTRAFMSHKVTPDHRGMGASGYIFQTVCWPMFNIQLSDKKSPDL